MTIRLFFSIWLIFIAGSAAAFDAQTIGKDVVGRWQGWMKKHGIREGSIIVSHEGSVISEGEINRRVDEPAKVASLSKAITAICVLTALKDSAQNAQTKLRDVIPNALAAHPPRDDRFLDISVGQLINHTSGIASDYHRVQLPKLKTFTKENKLWQFSKIVEETLSNTPGSASYRYSNANYLILGLVVEALSGESYEEYCQRKLFTDNGITTASLNSDWKVMSSWGGWEISARDYLLFSERNFSGDFNPVSPAGHTLTVANLGRGRSYGAGIIFRRTGLGYTSWHQGSWIGVRGRANDPFGAYVALYDNGFSVVTNYAHDASKEGIRGELDTLLYDATHP